MLAIANTDHSWFCFHRDNKLETPINFWTPTPWRMTRLSPGDRLYFMRKAPIRKIGGFGVFEQYLETTPVEAWERWGVGNGVEDYDEFLSKMSSYAESRSVSGGVTSNSLIGNIVLVGATFFDEHEYIDLDNTDLSFPRQIVKFKTFPLHSDLLATAKRSETGDTRTTGPVPRSSGYTVSPKDPQITRAFTYIARFGITQVYKIGYSEDLDNRLRTLNQHIPSSEIDIPQWRMVYARENTSALAQQLEQDILKKKLDAYRTEGERVYCRAKAIDAVARDAQMETVS
jgi:hypothetical protein